MAQEMAKAWPTLEIDRRDLPLIVKIAAKNSQFRDFELTAKQQAFLDREAKRKEQLREAIRITYGGLTKVAK
jgi:hypothetical protein